MPNSKKKDKQKQKSVFELKKQLVKTVNKGVEPKPSPFASFSLVPKKVKFVGTDSQEKVVLLLRRHPITNFSWIATALILMLMPVFLSFFEVSTLLPADMQLVLMMVWYLIVTAFVFEQFLGWYFNVYVITDERVFDVDFVNLIYREITDANIDQIQDVTVRVSGTLRTFLNYGDILIQTASETPQIEFDAVPRPDDVASVLRELRVEEEIEKLEGRVR